MEQRWRECEQVYVPLPLSTISRTHTVLRDINPYIAKCKTIKKISLIYEQNNKQIWHRTYKTQLIYSL